MGVLRTDAASATSKHHTRVVVSGNANAGMRIDGTHATVERVYVGVAADGVTPVPNGGHGLELRANGAVKIGPGTIISGNRGSGILITSRVANSTSVMLDG